VSLPLPSTLLRHAAPALLLATIETFDRDRIHCTSPSRSAWAWPEMLEAAAQAAGLLAGLQDEAFDANLLIAEYRDVRIHAARHAGALALFATLDRKVLHFRRCRVEVRAADGGPLLDGLVTLAPGADHP